MLTEVLFSTVLIAAAQRCGPGESIVVITTGKSRQIAVCGSAEPSLLFGESVETALSQDLSRISEIKSVHVERAEGNLLVWVCAEKPSREVRERIFEKQFGLIEAFPEISFDFNIVSSGSAPVSETASDAKLIYAR